MSVTLTCRWVPGTLDRVLVRTPDGATEVSISRVHQVLGREALECLYLRGSFVLDADDQRAWTALEALMGSSALVASAAD